MESSIFGGFVQQPLINLGGLIVIPAPIMQESQAMQSLGVVRVLGHLLFLQGNGFLEALGPSEQIYQGATHLVRRLQPVVLLEVVQGQGFFPVPLAGQLRRKEQDLRILGVFLEKVPQKLQGLGPAVQPVQGLGQPFERGRGLGIPLPDLTEDHHGRLGLVLLKVEPSQEGATIGEVWIAFPGFLRQSQGQVEIALLFRLLGALIQGFRGQIEVGVLSPGIDQHNSQKGDRQES
jgi:hypothetical protein